MHRDIIDSYCYIATIATEERTVEVYTATYTENSAPVTDTDHFQFEAVYMQYALAIATLL